MNVWFESVSCYWRPWELKQMCATDTICWRSFLIRSLRFSSKTNIYNIFLASLTTACKSIVWFRELCNTAVMVHMAKLMQRWQLSTYTHSYINTCYQWPRKHMTQRNVPDNEASWQQTVRLDDEKHLKDLSFSYWVAYFFRFLSSHTFLSIKNDSAFYRYSFQRFQQKIELSR